VGISRAAVVFAVLIVVAAISLLPEQVASAQPPSTAVLIPSNNATVSGTGVVLDAGASSGVTGVQFELTGGSLSDLVIATAVRTYYGWIAKWNSTTEADGTYTLQSVATKVGSTSTSPGISITVSNGAPSVSIVLPSDGSTLSGSRWLDALASPGVTSVDFVAVTGTPGVCPQPLAGPGGVCPIGDATRTYYGWLIEWDTTAVPNTDYLLTAQAKYPNGASGLSSFVGITVANPGPTVVVPANNSTVSASQWLDCTIPSGLSGPVQFWVLSAGGGFPGLLGAATFTEYGWLYDWNTTSVADGSWTLLCSATYPNGGTGYSDGISVTVAN
jgi:chitinase